jgi:hypothetical protein
VAGALRNLSVSAEAAQLIVERDGIRALVTAATTHAANAIVQASHSTRSRSKDGHATRRACSHTKYLDNAIVQAGVAGALRNLSASETTRQAIVAAGGKEALAMATQLHADNERLQAEVAGALRNLAGVA